MSPVWAIWTLDGSTPSSSKISIWRGPVLLAGREWAMIGAPGLDARPGGRAVDLLDVLVDAWLVGRALDEGGLDLGALDALLDVGDEELGDLVGVAIEEELGEMVVGVDPGAGDDLEPGLLGDAPHEVDVASQEHRGRLRDRLDAQIDGGLRLSHGDVVVLARRDLVRRLLLGGTRLGHWLWTASSALRRCSWIRVVPSSSASIGPVTVCTCAMESEAYGTSLHRSGEGGIRTHEAV